MRGWLLPLLADRFIRLLWLLPLAAVGLFWLISLAPIDPVQAYVGGRTSQISPDQRDAIAAAWGLDLPAYTRFFNWLRQLLQWDLGLSITYNAPVAQIIATRFPASLLLVGLAFGLSFLLGTTLGLVAGATQGRWPDRIIRTGAVLLAASPSFWIAILFVAVFAVGLGWLPACCATSPGHLTSEVTLVERGRHMVLPVLTLSIVGIAPLVLHTRQSLIAFSSSPAARHLASHGARPVALAFGAGLRHAAGVALTVHLASAGELFGGSVLAEAVFAWPGLGQATVRAATGADAPLLMGIGLATLLFVFTGNLLADIAARMADPRLRGRA